MNPDVNENGSCHKFTSLKTCLSSTVSVFDEQKTRMAMKSLIYAAEFHIVFNFYFYFNYFSLFVGINNFFSISSLNFGQFLVENPDLT